jgi:hypothetical protein
MHPSSQDIEFKAVSVSGECVVGLADGERHEPLKRLAVLEWCALTEANVRGELLRMLNEMPRAKRSVSKRTAIQCCPALVEAHCASEFARSMRHGSQSRTELEEVARTLCCDSWGFLHVPDSIIADVDNAASVPTQGPKKQRTLQSFFKVRRD